MKTVPLLLEFAYERVIRPSDSGAATDTRLIAVGYHSFSIKSAATGEVAAHFDLAGKSPPGFCPLYGLSHPEPWGIWSEGTRSCVLMDVPALPDTGFSISVDHHIFGDSSSSIRAKVWANGRPAGEVEFRQDEVEFTIRPDDGFEAIAAAASSNVSLSLSPAPAVSIVIVNYNRPDLTRACIAAVLTSQTNAPYEIVVVDNGSDPAAFSALASADLPIQITRLDDRRSFGEANNVAAERAHGAHILLLNNDAFVGASCIDGLLAALGDHRVGAAGPVLYDCEGRLQEAGAAISGDGNVNLRDYSYSTDLAELPPVSHVDHISAACLMVRKHDFTRLGGFDPVYDPAYHEDVDFSCRLRATGKSVALVRDARCLHIRNATVKRLQPSDSMFAAPERSLQIFRSRWGAWLWTRDARDAPATLAVSPADLHRQLGRFDGEPVNAILCAEPGKDLHPELAISRALARSYPTLLCTRTPFSMLRLLHLTDNCSLPAQQVATASEQSLGTRNIKAFVHCTSEIPPAPREYGERQILHCRTPIRPQGLSEVEMRARIQALSRIDAIVTNSELARRKILGALSYVGGPALPVSVIRTPIVPAEVALEAKQSLVVSVGPFRRGPFGGGHDVILRSFQKFGGVFQDREWQLICMGDIQSLDDLRYYQDFSYRAAAWRARCIAMPTSQQKREVLRRAKVCVSTNNWGISSEDEVSMKLRFECSIGDALAQACVPVVASRGVEAEICEYLQLGFAFDVLDDIEEQIALAASFAENHDLATETRRWTDALSLTGFYEQWEKLRAGAAQHPASSSAQE